MRSMSMLLCCAAFISLGATAPLSGQTFSANTGVDPVIGTPEARAARITVPAHRHHAEDKLIYGRVRDGVYTVDGMTAKVKLNYDVDGVQFLYMFVPGIGTAVISVLPDPDAVATEATYKDTELDFHVGDHRFKLTGVALASDKGTAPAHLFVKLDRSAWGLNRHPMMGFGNMGQAPYVWPGALRAETASQTEEPVIAPPLPAVLLPSVKPVTPAFVPASVDTSALHPATLR